MPLINTLIYLIIVLAVIAIVWWAISHFDFPQPVRIVAIAVIAIIALLLLVSLLPGGAVRWPTR
jgi:cation transporter-like permease